MIPRLEKRSGDSRVFDFDFSGFDELLAGDTLATAAVEIVAPADPSDPPLDVGAVTVGNGRAQVRIKDGENGISYFLQVTAQTTNGNTLVGEAWLWVNDPTGTN